MEEDDDDDYQLSHKSVTTVRRRDVTNELRSKIFQRISERRSQMIDQRRKHMSTTPAQPIQNQLMQEAQALTTDFFEDRPDDMTIEEWNDIYIQV